MPRLKESCKQDLKLRINIVDVVSRVATPRRAGGNRFKAATVGDLGFEPTLGATSADAKPVRRRTKTI